MAETTGPVLDEAARRAHDRLIHDTTLQHRFTESIDKPAAPDVPGQPWDLDGLSDASTVVFYLALGALALVVVYLLIRTARDFRRPIRSPSIKGGMQMDDVQAPSRNAALLAQADALAAQGEFDAAVHTLLLQGVQDIGQRYPALLRPAYTSRVIASLEGLPQQMREVYSRIAAAVERSRFGGRPIDAGAYADCRAAYAAWAPPA